MTAEGTYQPIPTLFDPYNIDSVIKSSEDKMSKLDEQYRYRMS